MARRKPKSDDKTKVASPPAAPASDAPASIPPSDEGRPGPESDQRLPENLEQAATASEQPDSKGADDDASNAAPTPPDPPELESAPLFAVCAVRIADKYFAPGARIDEEYADQLSEADFTALLAGNSIREG